MGFKVFFFYCKVSKKNKLLNCQNKDQFTLLLKTYQKVKKTIQKELHQMTFLGTSQEKGFSVFQ